MESGDGDNRIEPSGDHAAWLNWVEEGLAKIQVLERDRLVLQMRFGFGDYEDSHNLQEVAEVFLLTRERVRQISDRLLAQIRLNYLLPD